MIDTTPLAEELERTDFNGVVVVRQGGKTTFATARGLATRRWQVPNSLETRFDTASITKLFTSVAVLAQVDAGELDLDRSIHDYVDLAGTTIDRAVTLRHLLTHTSGIADDADEEAGEDYAALFVDKPNYSIMASRDFLPQFVHKEANAAPGETCRYCNVGYVLAGLALERVTGRPYRDVVVDRVFARAGMSRSGFFDRRDDEPDVAEGWDRGDDGRWKANIYSYPPIGSPDGGAHVTAGDLLRFLDAARGGELLSAESTRAFFTPHVRHDDRIWYGFGLEFDGRTFYKEGVNAGASGVLIRFGSTDADVVILSNTERGAWEPLRVAGRLFGGPRGEYGPVGP
jgi:CubicO group peptidase (beta-lactamase class C family)